LFTLYIEDSPTDYEAFQRIIDRQRPGSAYKNAESAKEALEVLQENNFDIVLLDLNLPDASGMDLIQQINNLPIVVLTGSNESTTIVQAMKLGAVDYLVKDVRGKHLDILPMTLERAYEHWHAEQKLKESQLLLQIVFDTIPHPVALKDLDGRFRMVNLAMSNKYGLEVYELIGKRISDFYGRGSEINKIYEEQDVRVISEGKPIVIPQVFLQLPNGREVWERHHRVPYRDKNGNIVGIVVMDEDITEAKNTETALRQAQHMESLAVLAGGIAHDFNNLLVPIMGYASMLLSNTNESTEVYQQLKQIESSSERAAELCRQMLAYAGQGSLEKQDTNLNQLIREMISLIKTALPKSVSVDIQAEADLSTVFIDRTQLRQVVMNLVINAGEAIGNKDGRIIITTSQIEADRDYLSAFLQAEELAPGPYLKIEIDDNGEGISEEVLPRIFEPFFTTKFTGRGLGLSAVAGIVRAHNGTLKVESEPGKGTCFTLLIPPSHSQQVAPPKPEKTISFESSGTILIVDDEQNIREVLASILASWGYDVLTAEDGAEALSIFETRGKDINLMLVDLTMPIMDGVMITRKVKDMHPDLPVILASGYSEVHLRSKYGDDLFSSFLQKPFRIQLVRSIVNSLLGQET